MSGHSQSRRKFVKAAAVAAPVLLVYQKSASAGIHTLGGSGSYCKSGSVKPTSGGGTSSHPSESITLNFQRIPQQAFTAPPFQPTFQPGGFGSFHSGSTFTLIPGQGSPWSAN